MSERAAMRGDNALGDAEYRLVCELVREHCGLHFGPDARYLVEKRLAARMRECGESSFAAYHYRLRKESAVDPELAKLIDDLTTNETYFLRERGPLRALIEEIVPEAADLRRAQGGGPVSIWSAGCASGEEPYSIVMLALEAGLVPGRDLRVYASDISRPALQKARRGVYREASFRETEASLRARYFSEKDGLWKIHDSVKQHVDLIHVNLFDRTRIALLGQMDVILCRNVIIYFDAHGKKRVIQTFWEKLRPGGHLLLGHSESLINLSNAFELRHLRNDMVYRRASPGERPRPTWERVESAANAALLRAEADAGPELAGAASSERKGRR
jgi:chemotaxis protein methyltransferase CheR